MSQTLRQPTESEVRAALGSHAGAHPHLERIVEGGDASCWFVNDDLVARFSPDAELTARFETDMIVREIVRAQVRTRVALNVARGEWADGLGWLLDERLPGWSSEKTPVSPGGCLQLGDFLHDMREIQLDGLGLSAIPEAPDTDAILSDAIARVGEVPPGLVDPNEVAAISFPERTHPDVLLHGDLKGEHILVDRGGAVTGIVDWSDAGIGDPMVDIAGIVISVGATMGTMVARQAGYEQSTIDRGIALAKCASIIEVADVAAGTSAAPEDLVRRQLRRAWEPCMGL